MNLKEYNKLRIPKNKNEQEKGVMIKLTHNESNELITVVSNANGYNKEVLLSIKSKIENSKVECKNSEYVIIRLSREEKIVLTVFLNQMVSKDCTQLIPILNTLKLS